MAHAAPSSAEPTSVPAPSSRPERPWHTVPPSEVLEALDSTSRGLDDAEADARFERYGPNRLPHAEPPPLWRVILRQFQSPLIYVLAVAGVLSLGIGEVTDAGFIFGVLVLNAIIGATQEWKAEQSSQALQKLLRTVATVVRNGDARDIDAEEVVPGDVVWLESGGRVPADIRLLTAQGLEVDESLLTGESLPVLKDPSWSGAEDAPVGDRLDMAFAGSIVVRGRAKGVVVETGIRTLVGRLAEDVLSESEVGRPPLVLRLERFTRAIAVAVLGAATIVGVVGVVGQGQSVTEMFLFAVAMAVSAIPEGLPVALTVALSVATSRMAKRGVIVRRLTSVEGLGSCTLIASDKTGTLTCNELTVRAVRLPDGRAFRVTGEGYAPTGGVVAEGNEATVTGDGAAEDPALRRFATGVVLCNEAVLHRKGDAEDEWTWRGDPTEVALLSFGRKLGLGREALLDLMPERNAIPFEPERKYAATFHVEGGDEACRTIFIKGAPERVLEMCSWPEADDPEEALWRYQQVATEMAAEGYRVLAVAEGTGDAATLDGQVAPGDPTGLTFLGFVGMIDPLRPGVREAVRDCHAAGIGVTMVTGDHPVTALAIARDLGLAERPEEVLSGADLADLSPEQLGERVHRVRVFARVSPRQKLEIVEAAQKAGHFVAVTGDGVNDAPALREANIGVAMGKQGTDVAREAADLVITDDNFATIVAGVDEGRVAYMNVRKVIYLLISTGAGEVVLISLSLFSGMPLPLTPVQLLWLNLVTNGIQDVALAFEPREHGVLAQPPRAPDERIFNQIMIERTLLAALVMGGVGFFVFQTLLSAGWALFDAQNAMLLLMVLFEIIHISNCRSETTSLFVMSPLKSPILLVGTTVAFIIHVLAMYWQPAEVVLGIAPVSLEVWGMLLVAALSIALVMELHKLSWWLRNRSGGGSPKAVRVSAR